MRRYSRSLINLCVVVLCLTALSSIRAQAIYWTGQGGTSNWSDPGNWDPSITPLGNQDLKFAETNARTTNVNDIGGAVVGYSAASVEFTAAGPAANTSGATVNAAAYTITGNPLAFFNAGSANTITNNSTHLQTLSFSDGGFGGIDVFVPNVTVIANNGNFHITSSIALNAGTMTFDGPANTTVDGRIYSQFTPEGIIKNGTGTLFLNNNSDTYTGGTAVNAGTLVIGGGGVLGSFGPNNDLNLNGGQVMTPLGTPLTYQVYNNFNANGGTLFVQTGSSTTGVNNDLMNVANVANLSTNSDLFAHQLTGFMPNNGDRITVDKHDQWCFRHLCPGRGCAGS